MERIHGLRTLQNSFKMSATEELCSSEPPDVSSAMEITSTERDPSPSPSTLFRRISPIQGQSPSFRRPSSSGAYQKVVLAYPEKVSPGHRRCHLGRSI